MGCIGLKPLVDQLENKLGGRAILLRVSIHTAMGQEIRERYGSEFVPLFVVFDSNGKETFRAQGLPSVEDILR